jgi:quercetin dioxygenase-like cupin family protein
MRTISRWSVLGLAVAAATGSLVEAQAPGLQRTIVQRADVSVPGRETVIARVEIAPGASAGFHTHPGEEMAYVMEGEAELSVEGQPTRTVKVGDGFVVPAGVRHNARNTGTQTFKVVSVYLIEKGKPLATPAP